MACQTSGLRPLRAELGTTATAARSGQRVLNGKRPRKAALDHGSNAVVRGTRRSALQSSQAAAQEVPLDSLSEVAAKAAEAGAEVAYLSIAEKQKADRDFQRSKNYLGFHVHHGSINSVGPEVVSEALDKPKNISFKGATDLVTDTDQASEAAVLGYLQKQFPDHAFLGEEGGVSGNAGSQYLWAVDPLDGTTNFSHAYPSFGVSVAVLYRGQPKAASVVEFGGGPHAWVSRTFEAREGGGALCNGRKISVSETDDVTRSLLVTGFGYEHDSPWSANMELFKHFTDVSQGVRRLGAAAIDLCHVAIGVSDGFWEYRLKPWDMAAGVLMVREAGGKVTTMNGEPFSAFSRSLLATNGRLHREILDRTGPTTDKLQSQGVDLSPWYVPSGYEFDEE